MLFIKNLNVFKPFKGKFEKKRLIENKNLK